MNTILLVRGSYRVAGHPRQPGLMFRPSPNASRPPPFKSSSNMAIFTRGGRQCHDALDNPGGSLLYNKVACEAALRELIDMCVTISYARSNTFR